MSLIHTIYDLEDHDFQSEFIILKGFERSTISFIGFVLMYEYYSENHNFGVFANMTFLPKQVWHSNPRFTNYEQLLLTITASTGEKYMININKQNYGAVQLPSLSPTISIYNSCAVM
jgi:hypothetical protein